ncbi:hypothetical protein [Brevibacterium sandarakinum]|uniref:hypothetical protein n=1 Tax=Brevibacterium sandarakinum TaxID=629680 RepID=UPI001E3CE523|nr:hypothetical protein [Brevibacterium sandarakinum]
MTANPCFGEAFLQNFLGQSPVLHYPQNGGHEDSRVVVEKFFEGTSVTALNFDQEPAANIDSVHGCLVVMM